MEILLRIPTRLNQQLRDTSETQLRHSQILMLLITGSLLVVTRALKLNKLYWNQMLQKWKLANNWEVSLPSSLVRKIVCKCMRVFIRMLEGTLYMICSKAKIQDQLKITKLCQAVPVLQATNSSITTAAINMETIIHHLEIHNNMIELQQISIKPKWVIQHTYQLRRLHRNT